MKRRVFQTITGRALALEGLDAKEREFLAAVQARYEKEPTWSAFAAWWPKALQRSGLSAFRVKGRVVHLQWWSLPTFPIYYVMLWLLRLRGKRVVLTVHNVLPHESGLFDKFCIKVIVGLGDVLLVHSDDNKRKLVELFNIKEDNVVVINMGIHTYTDFVSREDARKKFNLFSSDKVIL